MLRTIAGFVLAGGVGYLAGRRLLRCLLIRVDSDSGWKRLRLRRSDGLVYLERWGVSTRVAGVYLHRMSAPDPGRDLHDHPWPFVTIVLRGGYVERRADVRTMNEQREVRRPWRPRIMRLDEAHTITRLRARRSWSLILHGPRVREWGFYVTHPTRRDRWSFVDSVTYHRLPGRELANEARRP